MKAALFRKLTIDGKNYYQLYDVSDNFEVTDKYLDFPNRMNGEYSYLELSDELYSRFIDIKYMVFEGDDSFNIEMCDINKMKEVLMNFNDKYQDFDSVELETEDKLQNLYSLITNEVDFQDDAIINILGTIKRNFDIMDSDIDNDDKLTLKENIMLLGLPETGKTTTIKSLKRHMGVPYADIKLTPNFEDNIKEIKQQLLNSCNGQYENIDKGIIYVRDNLDELASYNEVLANDPFLPLCRLMSRGKIVEKELGINIDMNMLTFVVVMNVPSLSEMEDYLAETEDLPNMSFVFYNELTPSEQKSILMNNPRSVINVNKKILLQKGRTLEVDEEVLDSLILSVKNMGGGMKLISEIIDKLIKLEWYKQHNIKLTTELLNDLVETDENINSNAIEKTKTDQEKSSSNNTRSKRTTKEEKKAYQEKFNYVSQHVKGHNDTLNQLLSRITDNDKVQNGNYTMREKRKKIVHILLRGKPGTGKTYMTKLIAESFKDKPFFITDATEYSETGFVGNSVEDMLIQLYHIAGDDVEKAQKGILIIDEFDKIAKSPDSGKDVSRVAVQNALLTIFDGNIKPIEINKMGDKILFDTSELQIVCLGAFEGLEEHRAERLKKESKVNLRQVGFMAQDKIQEVQKKIEESRDFSIEDYKSFGMTKQILRRFKKPLALSELTKEDYRSIVLSSKDSDFLREIEELKSEGIEVIYDDEFINKYVDKAYNLGYGVSGLGIVLEEIISNVHVSIKWDEYEKVILTGECVDDPSKVQLIKAAPKKAKVKKLKR